MKKIIFAIFITVLISTISMAQQKAHSKKNSKTKRASHSQKKELVYLFTANGGMLGYFSDGSVVGCPRCDFCKTAILSMFKAKPSDTWDLKKPSDFVSYEEDNGWVLINYKWKKKVPQF